MLTGSWIITRRRPDAFVGRADSLIKGGECSKRSQDDYTNWPNGVNFKVHCNWSCVTCRMRCSGRDSELNRGQSGFFYILHASYLQSGGTGSWERAWGFIENIILFSGWVPIGVHTCMHHVDKT
ncbi:uncharacterized protein LAJ45_05204 [Morchella importuna]|uniref:uncharacterized protein n=1 Tax=Morchella importuna TaxID=1174673 RepID=UPI001E8D8185|nr:uncharacterized protein LAJ45_05204 [Morchella importuna]KAH8150509.1 hypothetical protein LAJ45_05204 [Morchella importuna]